MTGNAFHQRLSRIVALFAALLFAAPAMGVGLKPADRQALPDISWSENGEQTRRLSESHGKPRILHFWAAWCIPCREEMPDMLQWQQDNPDVTVIPLSLDQRIGQTRYFIGHFGLDMPALLVDEDARKKLKIPAVPYSLLVDGEGQAIARVPGMADWGDAAFTESVRSALGL